MNTRHSSPILRGRKLVAPLPHARAHEVVLQYGAVGVVTPGMTGDDTTPGVHANDGRPRKSEKRGFVLRAGNRPGLAFGDIALDRGGIGAGLVPFQRGAGSGKRQNKYSRR